jgi:hypothetical protein
MTIARVALAFWSFLVLAPAAADVAVIANPALPGGALSLDDVKNIWLGKTRMLAGEVPVRPVDQAVNSVVRDVFYRKTLDKNPQQVKAYWARVAFTGRRVVPAMLNGDEAVKEWVAGHADAVGYINAAAVDKTVKVVLLLK